MTARERKRWESGVKSYMLHHLKQLRIDGIILHWPLQHGYKGTKPEAYKIKAKADKAIKAFKRAW
jgi:hypothetical protein